MERIPQFARFLDMALASLAETEAVVNICRDLAYFDEELCRGLFEDIRVLTGMLMNLKKACRHELRAQR